MPQKILDLHIHSRYSRACSRDLELPQIARACERVGIDIVTTGDFTHPKWFEHIQALLVEDAAGLYRLVDHSSSTRFIIGTEVACIKKDKGQTRRVHHLLFAPSIEVAGRFNQKLVSGNFNLKADGRPILGLTSKQLLEIMLEVDGRMVMIPAHAWTPWFGIFGAKGGYDSLEEAYDELAPHIRAIETGLPIMNALVPMLDSITLISNSDAHSLQKLGREANVFQFPDESSVTYAEIMRIIAEKDRKKFVKTLEFYPEEGKYHYDGHRDCKIVFHPRETEKHHGLCPVCGRSVTIGVMNRIYELSKKYPPVETQDIVSPLVRHIPHQSIVPLREIISNVLGVGVASKRVSKEYEKLITHFKNEFFVLLESDVNEVDQISTGVGDALLRVRTGNIHVRPGYDGEFGVVEVFGEGDRPGMRQQGLDLE